MWTEEPKRGDLLAKAFPSFKDEKIYLNCRKCQHPCLIYGSISSGWNIGPLKRHLKLSTECAVIDVNTNTTSMVPSNILTVSLVLFIIPHAKCTNATPGVEPVAFYSLWYFDFIIWFLLLFFQHSDDDRDSGSEEMHDSSIVSLLATSDIVSLFISLTFSAVIVKLANFGDFFFI